MAKKLTYFPYTLQQLETRNGLAVDDVTTGARYVLVTGPTLLSEKPIPVTAEQLLAKFVFAESKRRVGGMKYV